MEKQWLRAHDEVKLAYVALLPTKKKIEARGQKLTQSPFEMLG